MGKSMISLKKFLDSDREKLEALERLVDLLLQGTLVHTIEGAPDDYASLRDRIQRISAAIAKAKSGEEYLIQAGAFNSSLEEYRRRTSQFFEQRRAEMKNIIHMLTNTISAISEASKENLERLRRIEAEVSNAAQVEDVRVIKSKLSECLEEIRKEAERQKTHTSRTLEELGKVVRRAQTTIASDPAAKAGDRPAEPPGAAPATPELDQVTGLPGRQPAEDAIERACCREEPVFAGVIIIDSLPAINLKYGRGTGDEVLQGFGDYIAQRLAPDDELFRWSGPTLVALLRRSAKIEQVRSEFARLMEQKFEHTIQRSSRAIHFPVAKRWAVLQIPIGSAPGQLYRKIDAFISPAIDSD
jgi:GGDEF domain-containing protein